MNGSGDAAFAIQRVPAGSSVTARPHGHQHFIDGGPGSLVCLNGNPGDYRFEATRLADGSACAELVALNGSGAYRFADSIARVGFVSGAFSLLRNLPAVIAAGDRTEVRAAARRHVISHAQIREDVRLMRALRHVEPASGFYIDIGAYDPDVDTVTRAFYDLGWRGLNVEPSPEHLARLRARRPRDVNLGVAVSATAGTMRFFRNGGEQLGTLEPRFADGVDATEVETVRLADLCHAHAPTDIHFLKIDVEGHERSVLEGADFATFRPWIVVIEAVAPNRADIATFGEWEDIILDAGYALAGEDELNRYYLAQEHRRLATDLATPVDIYVPGALLAEHDALLARISKLEARLADAPRGGRGLFGLKRGAS